VRWHTEKTHACDDAKKSEDFFHISVLFFVEYKFGCKGSKNIANMQTNFRFYVLDCKFWF
jgi:hypothetical protein